MSPILGIMASSKQKIIVTGGFLSSDATYYYRTFLSNETFTVTKPTAATSFSFDVAKIDGGVSSSFYQGAQSGGGLTAFSIPVNTQTYSTLVQVGAGGTGGGNGSSSSVSGITFTNGWAALSAGSSTGSPTGGVGGGGGGGIGGVGGTGSVAFWYSTFYLHYGAAGGVGSTMGGFNLFVGGGGGGAAYGGTGDHAAQGSGGSGGGGTGGAFVPGQPAYQYAPTSGAAGTGGGGGGWPSGSSYPYASGGSGVVQIRYTRVSVGG